MTRTRTVCISPRLLTAIQADAARRGKSISWCVERAWSIAWPRLGRLDSPTPVEQDFDYIPPIPDLNYTNVRAEQIYADRFASEACASLELELGISTVEDMTDESYRLARSLAWLVERAWCIALDAEASATWFVASDFAGDTAPMSQFE